MVVGLVGCIGLQLWCNSLSIVSSLYLTFVQYSSRPSLQKTSTHPQMVVGLVGCIGSSYGLMLIALVTFNWQVLSSC